MPRPKAAPTDELTVEEFILGLRGEKQEPEGELSPEEFAAGISDVYPKESSRLRQIAAGALENLATGPELGAIAAQKLSGALGLPQETPFFSGLAGGLRGAAQLVDPLEARGQGGLAEDLTRTAGGILGSIPALAAGPGAAAIQFGAQSGVPLYYEIKAKTGDDEAATYGLLFGLGVGQLERFGAEKFAGNIVKRLAGKGVKEAIESLILRYATGASSEIATEATQTALEDLIYESLTDEDVDNWENIKRTVPVSGLLGGGFSAVDTAIQRAQTRAEAKAAQEAPKPPTEAQETVSPTGAPPATPAATPAGIQAQAVPSATPTAPVEPSTAPEAVAAPSEPSVPEQAEVGSIAAEGQAQQGATASSGSEGGAAVQVGSPGGPETALGGASAPTTSEVPIQPELVAQAEGETKPAPQAEPAATEKPKTTDLKRLARMVRSWADEDKQAFEATHGKRISSGKLDVKISKEEHPDLRLYRGEPRGTSTPLRAATSGAAGPGTYFAIHKRKADIFAGQEGEVKEFEAPNVKLLRVPANETVNAGEWNTEARERGYDGIWIEGQGEIVLFDAEKALSVEKPKTTGIANKAVERELKEMGLPLPEKGLSRKDVELHAEAKATFEKNKDAGRELVDRLEASSRPVVSDAEAALLTFEANRLKQERVEAEKAYLKSPSEAGQKRIEAAKADYMRAANLFKRVGSESGRALRARQLILAEDYSLAAMERAYSIAKGGEPLTAKESARIKELQEKLEITTKAHEEYVTQAELRRAADEAEKAVLRLQREAKSGVRRTKRAASIAKAKQEKADILAELKEYTSTHLFAGPDTKTIVLLTKAAAKDIEIGVRSFAQWADDMVLQLGERFRPFLRQAWDAGQQERRKAAAAGLKDADTPEKMHRGVQKIALSLVEEQGIKEHEALTKAVHEVIQEVNPGMSLEETRDAISGYGQFRKLTPGEARKTLRDLKGQMQQVAKLEALQAREAPKKTGFERQEPSPTQKRLAKQVRDLQRQLGLTVKPDRLKALKARLQNQITDLEARIKAKDFGEKPKPKPVQLDEEAIKLAAQKARTKRIFEREQETARRAQRTLAQKGLDAAKEVLDLPRALLSAFDFSAVRRQGGFFTSGHPFRSAAHAKEMFKAWANPEVASKVDAEVRKRAEAVEGGDKLELTSPDGSIGPAEEAIRSRLSDRIWGIPASNRAYITYLNLQRITALEALVRGHPGKPTQAEAQALAEFVNRATGRATGKGKSAARALEGIRAFWAPSYVISRFQLLFEPLRLAAPGGKGMTFAVRKAIGKELLRYIAGQSVYYALIGTTLAALAEANDEEFEVGTDPESPDFGKIRIGDTRVDPLSGMAQAAVFIGQEIAYLKRAAFGEKQPKGTRSGLSTAGRFVRSKFGPLQSRVANALAGENLIGEKMTPAQALLELPVPLAFDATRDTAKDLGIPATVVTQALSILGEGVQTYQDKKAKK